MVKQQQQQQTASKLDSSVLLSCKSITSNFNIPQQQQQS
jgi:hypothetical protein